jgi:hypothetical protein
MTETVDNLLLDLLEWSGRKERSYQETMEAWRTSCPRLPIWEDATDHRLVEIVSANGHSVVRIAPAGMAFLKMKRPHAYEELQRQSEEQSQATNPDPHF